MSVENWRLPKQMELKAKSSDKLISLGYIQSFITKAFELYEEKNGYNYKSYGTDDIESITRIIVHQCVSARNRKLIKVI